MITLSLFTPEDAAVMMAADGDPEMRRRFEVPESFVPSLEHSLSVVQRWAYERVEKMAFRFAVRDVVGTLLGGCELKPWDASLANLSYWTYPGHRRLGVASRAVALTCELAFTELNLDVLEVLTDPDNWASRRVAARNGFVETGIRGGQILHVRRRTDAT